MTGLLLVLPGAQAAVLDVPSVAYPTVASAVAAAAPGDLVSIAPGTYQEGLVVVSVDLTIAGTGGVPVLQGTDPAKGFFEVAGPGVTVTFQDLEFDGRAAFPALRLTDGSATLLRVAVHDTAWSGGSGGAIQATPSADALTVIDSTFTDSVASGGGHFGGMLAILGGDLTLTSSAFVGGVSDEYGGQIAFDGGALTIDGSTFSGGTSVKRGGALWIGAGDVAITASTFVGNTVAGDRGGGAIYAESPTAFTVTGSRFDGNAALGSRGGGAIYLENAPAGSSVDDAWFVGNTAPAAEGGGALYVRNGAVGLQRGVFCGNSTGGKGGAIHLHTAAAEVFLENGVFLENTATGDGGAIFSDGVAAVSHGSFALNASGAIGHAAAGAVVSGVDVRDSYLGDHGAGTEALGARVAAGASTQCSAWWNNLGGDWTPALAVVFPPNVTTDSLIPTPTVGACDPLELAPPAGSPLLGAACDGSDIGAFGGPATWTDGDGDGVAFGDCDDGDPTVSPGAAENVGDGVDQDCDGVETCRADIDGDGAGNPGTLLVGDDLDCADLGESANEDEVCEGFDDALDPDGDGVPTGCDLCPDDVGDDSDGDGSCDGVDRCAGADDGLDPDGDGVPSGCDACPDDPLDDSDGDLVCDSADLCPGSDDHKDADLDGAPDDCDPCPADALDDADGDEVCDSDDACAGFDDREDFDGDGVPNGCDDCAADSDADGDGVADDCDACPGADDRDDQDGDGIPDGCDDRLERVPSEPADDATAGCDCATPGTGPRSLGWGLLLLASWRARRRQSRPA